MILDHRGNPVKTQQLTQELAAPSLAGIRTVWDQSVAGGLTPVRLAALLLGAASGDANDFLTLAEEMEEKDLHYRCEIGKRKLAVASLPVIVEAASDDAKDVQLADEVRAMVKMAGFRGLLKDLLDGLGKGYSVSEIIWARGAKWFPASYVWRDPRFFVFDRASRQTLRLVDAENMAEGIELAPYKFIVHLPHLKTGIPIRGGIARVAAWAWMFKNYTVKDWMAFSEVYGMPLRVGKYQPSASKEDINILKMAVANLGSDAAAVIPDSMLIEFVDSVKGGSGSNDAFEKLANWLDAQVSRGVLGQTATTQGTPGKLGGDDAQAEVREDIRDDDASQLAETINRDLVRPFIDLNFGPQKNYPELVLRAVEPEDLNVLILALEKLVPLGLKVEQSVVRDKLGLPDPADDAECLGSPAPAAPAPTAEDQPVEIEEEKPAVATNQEEDPGLMAGSHPAEMLTERLLAETDLDPLLDPVRRLLETVESLEAFRDGLLDLYAEMDATDLGNLMQRAFVLAELAGRLDAENE
jgi:phage gp29-like protein